MKTIAALLMIATLASCGAAGAPLRPVANMGLTIGSGGVSTSCAVGGTNGTVTLSVAC
ncbi:hypothetical protein [Marivivens niveibacter]|uniref:hypothetical protein n=1 Tax=Marivivens niveibacter TaxID=1930667 RepID=UPI0013FDA486|nr:hypothetical protein [Marivivens niveibacter]